MPAPNIRRLTNLSPVRAVNYFIDANVWLYAVQGYDELTNWQTTYFNFFYAIIESIVLPQPKILMPTLLISEIINSYIKKIALPEYLQINGIDNWGFDYKRDYRPSQHYRDSLERICDDIHGFRSSLIFMSDTSLVNDQSKYLHSDIHPLDFNDNCYYQLCLEAKKSRPRIMVTNDSDFQIHDVDILTLNKTFLNS